MVYEYSVFWIREEIANHYYRKSDILFRFLRDYQNSKNREDLESQYFYITNTFPSDKLISHIEDYYTHDIRIEIKGTSIKIYRNLRCISLHIERKHLKFRCKTLQDAEELLFPMLRCFQPLLFITGNNLSNFGWISPMILTSNYQSEQVLYSYL
ncbi:sporulation inhibitor of replication protein SirA [Virgibacillus sp. C22-A2]|uniref:Sporulation inhibitor of replication protein SirA n=1 Tax=Virgibacillus tibetensis TaxID=3042313 RepID=A0ABU6KDT1_9BACI|nr:sporulation inhibitor of replication protein SirA [Virgibacillus sp. C22-A2]